MSVLVVINKILDIKIVQWALLGLVACLLGVLLYTQIRYNGLKLSYALLETKYAKVSTALDIQNSKIDELNKITEQYQIQLKVSQQNETKLNKLNEENKLKLKSFQFKPNSTCEEKVNQTLIQYLEMRNK
jgi:hypothetical protein